VATPPHWSAAALATLLVGAGSAHLLATSAYESLIPPALPGSARAWVVGSGVAELGCAVAVATPATRRVGAYATAALFVVVFPGNVRMAWQWRTRGPLARAVAVGRLPLQAPLVRWALRVAAAN
jgi:uncharacterized membrane protein